MAFDADTESESASLHHHLPLPERYKCLSRNTISLWVLYCMCNSQLRIIKEKKLGWEYSKEPAGYLLKEKVYKRN